MTRNGSHLSGALMSQRCSSLKTFRGGRTKTSLVASTTWSIRVADTWLRPSTLISPMRGHTWRSRLWKEWEAKSSLTTSIHASSSSAKKTRTLGWQRSRWWTSIKPQGSAVTLLTWLRSLAGLTTSKKGCKDMSSSKTGPMKSSKIKSMRLKEILFKTKRCKLWWANRWRKRELLKTRKCLKSSKIRGWLCKESERRRSLKLKFPKRLESLFLSKVAPK